MFTIAQTSMAKRRSSTRPDGRGVWAERVCLGGLALVAALLPLVVNPWWYDVYYWPKVQVLYGAVALLILTVLWRGEGGEIVRALGSPVGIALGAWLGAVVLSTVLSVDPLLSLVGEDYRYEGLLTWLAYGAVIVLSAQTATTPRKIQWLLAAVLASSVVMAVLGLLQYYGWSQVPRDFERTGWWRAWGTTGSPLALGAYLVLLLPLLVGMYARADHPGRRWFLGAVVVLLYAALIATRTRAAWAGLAVGAAVWAVAAGAPVLRRAAGAMTVLGLALAAVTPVVLLTGPLQTAEISERGAAEQRAFLWRTTLPLVWQRPFLGWGPETLSRVYPDYGTPEFQRVFPKAKMMRIEVDRPHSDLLQQAVSTGLLGLGAYVWLWCTLFRAGWQAARGDRGSASDAAGGIAAGLLGGIAGYFLQLQFSFSYVSVAPVFWSLAGVLLALAPCRPCVPGPAAPVS